MLGLPLAFTIPFALVALAGLPVLYVLLKVTPPRPERVPFPPLKLILDLKPKDETPANTPWWLLLLRLALATLVILAMAGPIWNPISVGTKGKGSLLIALDTSWAAAPTWERRVIAASQRIEAARQQSRTVAVAASSDGGRDIVATDPATALERLHALTPVPYAPDRLQLAGAIERFVKAHADTTIVWASDGLERGAGRAFAQALAALPEKTILISDDRPVLAITDPRNDGDKLAVRVLRSAKGDAGAHGLVRALDMKGLTIGEAPYAFGEGDAADATFDQPIELRNQIARLEVTGARSAGAVTLLDSRWKRRSVGIVSGDTADTAQPLLAPAYYLRKALGPFADVHEPKPGTPDPIGAMLDDRVNVLILADFGTITGPIRERLGDWVDNGGLLVRFAGTRLSGATDDLVPVKLRRGGRVLGGTLSWEKPKHLAAFEPPSPFVGLKVPDEVTITRQVLAEPEPGLPAKTWAQLSDGTPLVTAAPRGKGRVVLFHVTADTTWSNLPIAGLFVDMLKKIVALSGESARTVSDTEARAAQASRAVETVAPTRTLDGFGTLGAPPASAKPVPTTFGGISSSDHPPGFYGPADSMLAVNALAPDDKIPALDLSGLSFEAAPLQAAEPIDLRPWLIAGAFVLFCLDALAALWLGGKLRFAPRRAVAAALAAAVVGSAALTQAPQPARAEPAAVIADHARVIANDARVIASQRRSNPGVAEPQFRRSPAAAPGLLRFARNDGSVDAAAPQPPAPIKVSPNELSSALSVRLAYVMSGDSKVDEVSRQGLATLSTTLAARTSLTPGDPIGIDPARDELAFYPVLYWPIVAESPQPSQKAIEKISAYMRNGGTIVFDTRDANSVRPNGEPTPATAWLRQLLSGVDVPELEPIPSDHVVTKTFYLIDNFIGRYASGETWIEALPPPIGDKEARPARSGDGVSPIILTSNDLAAGWAGDDYGEPLYPLIPGDPRQHEIALRGGINLVMYTLTGNYKADQVHVRDLLERLGH